nr:MAG TPA: hypothetical protein [Caudoviricetes sp.]
MREHRGVIWSLPRRIRGALRAGWCRQGSAAEIDVILLGSNPCQITPRCG